MATEVCSPISRRGSAVGSGQPMSPGARSDPGRGDARTAAASELPRPDARRKSPAASAKVVGPED
jgi:hypothetical protein